MWPRRGERPRRREPGEEAWGGPLLQRPLRLAGIPRAQGSVSSLPNLGLPPGGYLESWSSLAFCRIWQTSVMG